MTAQSLPRLTFAPPARRQPCLVLLEGAPSGSTIYRTKSTSCSAESRIASSMSFGVGDAVDGATKAANASGLPQGIGGPADAYRHLLIAGELRRRFGPTIGASPRWKLAYRVR